MACFSVGAWARDFKNRWQDTDGARLGKHAVSYKGVELSSRAALISPPWKSPEFFWRIFGRLPERSVMTPYFAAFRWAIE
ncbi:MAG: hypothetical protein QF734_02215, partial [Arenicellales bacterium]|nr:hypothetical protein [Arenicellales bacterium]